MSDRIRSSISRVIRSLHYQNHAEKVAVTANFDRFKMERLVHLSDAETAVLEWILGFFEKYGEPPSLQVVLGHFCTANDDKAITVVEAATGCCLRAGGSFEETVEEAVEHQGATRMRQTFQEALEIATEGKEVDGQEIKGVQAAAAYVKSSLVLPPPKGEIFDPVEREIAKTVDASRRWLDAVASPPTCSPYFGLFEPGEVHLLAARSNAGKTALALWFLGHWGCGVLPSRDPETFALAVATEETDPDAALARVKPPERGRALSVYVSPEAKEADLARVASRFREKGRDHLGCDPGEFAAVNFFPVLRDSGDPHRFDVFRLLGPRGHAGGTRHGQRHGWEALAGLIEGLKREVRPSSPDDCLPLIAIDTITRMSPRDANEVANNSLTYLVEQLEWVAGRTGAAVLVLHHVSQQDHAKPFAQIDPLTYGRGGTGTAAAARTAFAMAPTVNGGDVVGLKRIANNLPPRGPIFYEVRAPGDRGICYYRPLRPDEAERREEEARAAAETAKREAARLRRPAPGTILRDLWERGGAGPHTTAEVRRRVAARWPKADGSTTYSSETDRVRDLAGEYVAEWIRAGLAEWSATTRGERSTRNFRLTAEPPTLEADPEEVEAVLGESLAGAPGGG